RGEMFNDFHTDTAFERHPDVGQITAHVIRMAGAVRRLGWKLLYAVEAMRILRQVALHRIEQEPRARTDIDEALDRNGAVEQRLPQPCQRRPER
ncbi:hypothetical protein DQE80_15095, partial [Enterococcus sp. HPCN18]